MPRSVSWNDHENLALSKAYDIETRDAAKGKDRRRIELWESISDRFRMEIIKQCPSTGFQYVPRTLDACRRQHIKIMHDVRKYNFHYNTILKKKPTGTNPEDWETQAHKLYVRATASSLNLPSTDNTKRVKFNYMNVWKHKRMDLNDECIIPTAEEISLDTPGFANTAVCIGGRPLGRSASKRMKQQDTANARLFSYLEGKQIEDNKLDDKTASLMDAKWIEVTARTLQGTDRGDEIVKNLKRMVEEQALDRIAQWEASRSSRTKDNFNQSTRDSYVTPTSSPCDNDICLQNTITPETRPSSLPFTKQGSSHSERCIVCDDVTSTLALRSCAVCKHKVHHLCQNELFFEAEKGISVMRIPYESPAGSTRSYDEECVSSRFEGNLDVGSSIVCTLPDNGYFEEETSCIFPRQDDTCSDLNVNSRATITNSDDRGKYAASQSSAANFEEVSPCSRIRKVTFHGKNVRSGVESEILQIPHARKHNIHKKHTTQNIVRTEPENEEGVGTTGKNFCMENMSDAFKAILQAKGVLRKSKRMYTKEFYASIRPLLRETINSKHKFTNDGIRDDENSIIRWRFIQVPKSNIGSYVLQAVDFNNVDDYVRSAHQTEDIKKLLEFSVKHGHLLQDEKSIFVACDK